MEPRNGPAGSPKHATLRGGAVWYATVAEDSRGDELLPSVRALSLTRMCTRLMASPPPRGGCLLVDPQLTKTAANILERILSADNPPLQNKGGRYRRAQPPNYYSPPPYPPTPTDGHRSSGGRSVVGGCCRPSMSGNTVGR